MPLSSENPGGYTFLLVTRSGKTITFRWFLAILVFGLICFIGAVSAAGIFYYLYQKTADENERLRARYSEPLPADVTTAIDEKSPTAEIAFTERQPSASAETDGNAEAVVSKTAVPEPAPADTADDDTNAVGESLENKITFSEITEMVALEEAASADNKPQVAIEDFKCRYKKNHRQLTVGFRIKNTLAKGKSAGHLVIVLKPDTGNLRQWAVLPEGTPLPGGKPTGKEKGYEFSILNYKPVSFTIKDETAPQRFKTALVYVFDGKEGLIAEENFPVALDKPEQKEPGTE